MRILYHFPLCPFSRKIRLILGEKKLDFALEIEKFWEKDENFLFINPAGQVPVLEDLDGHYICDSYAISEYLEEAYSVSPLLLGSSASVRAEVRRLTAWFDDKMAREVSLPLLFEKIFRRYVSHSGATDSGAIRRAKSSIHFHLQYISWLVDRRNWLAGEDLSLADLAAASHLSAVDYLGDVPWEHPDYTSAKEWYMRLKSRPSFRSLLSDRLPGVSPAPHYTNLDF